jgi:hypothetical protein
MHRSFDCAPVNFSRETVFKRFAHNEKQETVFARMERKSPGRKRQK